MLERRPDLAAALYEDVWRSRFGEEDEGDTLAYPLPVWGVRDGKFTNHYSRTFVEAAQRRPDIPRVTAAQWAALDLLWMAMPNSHALPVGQEVLWGTVAGGALRGGIGQTAAAPLR